MEFAPLKRIPKVNPSAVLRRLGWEKRPVRIGIFAAFGFLATILLIVVLYVATSTKQVTLIVEGEPVTLKTEADTVGELIQDEALAVRLQDYVSEPLTSELKDGQTIEIRKAVPVQFIVDDQEQTVYTLATDVRSLLNTLGQTVEPEDKVYPEPETSIYESMRVRVVDVETVVEEKEEVIPFEVVNKQDATLPKGKQQVVQEGQNGLVVKQIKKTYQDGKLVAVEEIGQTVEAEASNKIVAVGTKNPVTVLSAKSPDIQTVTKSGVTFGVKRILENVSLTAYHAGLESTGKTEEHPQYGITYSGTKVQEGRTAAVDPKVIPLGWWIYIEGYGFRKAEDIGSGVKGNTVDIYVEDADEAESFGRKKGYTVYVIGPDKPDID